MNREKVLIFVSFFVLIAGATGLYFVYKQRSPSIPVSTPVSVNSNDSASPKNFTGTFYLSLVPNNDTLPLGIYSYNLDNKSWTRVLVDNNVGVKDYSANISPVVSNDGSFMVFARRENVLTNKDGSKFEIYTSALDGRNLKQITNATGRFKRDLAIDNSNKLIAYVVQQESSATNIDPVLPESWVVYLTDLNGNVSRVADGTNPLFSPDGKKLLILQNNGLHLFDISNYKKPQQIGLVSPTVDGRASQTMKISLSRDGNMMAWSSVNKKNVVISKINSWDIFSISPFKVINAPAYWSVFSNDGKYLAVMKIKISKAGNDYGVISVYDINAKGDINKQVLSLGGYDEKYVWFGVWR